MVFTPALSSPFRERNVSVKQEEEEEEQRVEGEGGNDGGEEKVAVQAHIQEEENGDAEGQTAAGEETNTCPTPSLSPPSASTKNNDNIIEIGGAPKVDGRLLQEAYQARRAQVEAMTQFRSRRARELHQKRKNQVRECVSLCV